MRVNKRNQCAWHYASLNFKVKSHNIFGSFKLKLMNVALLWINDINTRVRVISTFRSGLHQVIGMCRGRLVRGCPKRDFFSPNMHRAGMVMELVSLCCTLTAPVLSTLCTTRPITMLCGDRGVFLHTCHRIRSTF